MNRLGFRYDNLARTLPDVLARPSLDIEAVFTHFATADEPEHDLFDLQRRRFLDACDTVRALGGRPRFLHAANSAACLRDSRVWFDVVRPGLLLYGVVPPPLASTMSLRPAMSLTSRVVAVKGVRADEGVGYGARHRADAPTSVAVVPAGYADGLDRRLEGRGAALIRGRRVPIVGAVSMDMLTVDVTAVADVSTGDEVVFMGSQGAESWQTIDAREMASSDRHDPVRGAVPPGGPGRAEIRLVVTPRVRYRFGAFVLSPHERTLWRDGQPVPLIPRYFDVLLLLVTRRNEAVSKSDIFEAVWTDVIVSDGALAQAIRTLRRALGDDSRQPLFIRTVSRHGYQFLGETVEEDQDDSKAQGTASPEGGTTRPSADADVTTLLERLMSATAAVEGDADAREAAERLHALGTDTALALLTARPGHARALAFLRDARWSVATAGPVPLANDNEGARTALEIVRLRLRDGAPLVAARCAGAGWTGALAGGIAGIVGGVALALSPTSQASVQACLALGVLGALAGGPGVAAVAGGMATAEVVARSGRVLALLAAAALAGAVAGAIAQAIVASLLFALFGLAGLQIPGLPDGLLLGAAAGVAYAATTHRATPEGLAAPSGRRRLVVVLSVALCCAIAAWTLGWLGRSLVGGLVHQVARATAGSQLGLEPLGRLVGEPSFGPTARALLAGFEGGVFGAALALSLTRRPGRSREQPPS